MFYKKIICLANSKKNHGRCVAGKNTSNGQWIRPVSDMGALSVENISYENGSAAALLDVIRIPFERKTPTTYQPENILISEGTWEKIDEYSISDLDNLCEDPTTLWQNNGGYNDKIPQSYMDENRPESSLVLIKPQSIRISRDNFFAKKNVRAQFNYNEITYNLKVTDLDIINKFTQKPEGIHPLRCSEVYLCLSLAGPFPDNYFYKLLASIIYR